MPIHYALGMQPGSPATTVFFKCYNCPAARAAIGPMDVERYDIQVRDRWPGTFAADLILRPDVDAFAVAREIS